MSLENFIALQEDMILATVQCSLHAMPWLAMVLGPGLRSFYSVLGTWGRWDAFLDPYPHIFLFWQVSSLLSQYEAGSQPFGPSTFGKVPPIDLAENRSIAIATAEANHWQLTIL